MNNNYYYKLGLNIKALRETYHETQQELASAIGVDTENKGPSISNYERGERIPQRDYLFKIAKHYRVTVDELIHCDYYSDALTLDMIDAISKDIFNLLPIINNEQASENSNFNRAYDLHIFIKNKFQNKEDFDISIFNECKELYSNAANEGVIEARANLLWLSIVFGIGINYITVPLINELILSDFNLSNRKIIKNSLPIFASEPNAQGELDRAIAKDDLELDKELSKIKKAYYDETIPKIYTNIKCLRQDLRYLDLADFYLALSFLSGFTPDESYTEMGSAIAYNLFCSYYLLSNKYVLAIMKCVEHYELHAV